MDLLSPSTVGGLLALGSALTWAGTSLLVRSLDPHFNTVTINALRSVASGAMLLAWVLATSGFGPFGTMSARTFGLLALSIVLAIAVGDTVFFESVRAVGVARALAVSMTYPLFSAALAAAFLGEPVTARGAAGALVTVMGLALIVTGREVGTSSGGRFSWGLGAATLASLAWALSVAFLKPALVDVDIIMAQAVRLPLAGGMLWATPWAWDAHRRLAGAGPAVLGRLALLSALTALSSVMFVGGLKYAGVTVATVLSSTAPMFGIPLGFFFLGERLSVRAILGTVVTVLGITVLQA